MRYFINKKTALIIQEFQNDVISEGGAWESSGSPVHAKSQNVVENVKKLADRAHSLGIPVIHVHFVVENGAAGIKQNAPVFRGLKGANALVRGSWGAAPVAGLEPRPGDIVVEKCRMNAFYNTRLDVLLRGFGVETFIITGGWTNMSIEHTARHGADAGYEVIIASDGTYTLDDEWQHAALNYAIKNIASVNKCAEIEQAMLLGAGELTEGLQVKSPKMWALVGGPLEKLATGFWFTEGPIWNKEGNYLLFSDMPGDVRRRWSPAEGVKEVMRPANKCNGMTYDAAGNLIVCEHSTSQLICETPDGERKILASHYQGKELNSPNDVVVGPDGSIYFTDPPYGRVPVFGVPRERQLDFQGVYRVLPNGGGIELVVDDFETPNGLCLSPDHSLLYINDSTRGQIRVWNLQKDGKISTGRMFFENIGSADPSEGFPDGMKTDELGNVYVTGPTGIWVISPEGEHLGNIRVPETVGNLTFGDSDWKSLYVCGSSSIYRLRMKVAGAKNVYMG
jgi:gluconolactonase